MKYGGGPAIKDWEDFFRVLTLLKMSPQAHQVPLLFGDSNTTSLFDWANQAFSVLADCVDEIDWNARVNPFNHHPAAPHYTTFAVDTFLNSCLDGDFGDTTFQPKYAGNVFKIQVAVGWDGIVHWYRGPHLGSRSDTRLFTELGPATFMTGEFGWGDGIYSGNAPPLPKLV